MIYILSYLLIGYAVYFIIAHFTLQTDRNIPNSIHWIVITWPIVYLLGIIDVIDWIVKELKRE